MAIVMAILLKYFIIEAYKIPTGSMQPTLVGDDASGVKDRILVDKLSYAFSEPERWDVAVFRYPLNHAQNFVKRIVGVGPEEFRIDNGDLWARADDTEDWHILRRPLAVQTATWKQLDLESPADSSWRVVDGDGWELEGRSVRARGAGRASFRNEHTSIMDEYFDGYPEVLIPLMPEKRVQLNAVGDLRIDGEVTALAGTESVAFELREGRRRYRFVLPGPAAPETARPHIQVTRDGTWFGRARDDALERAATEIAAESEWRLPVGRKVRFGAQNLDDVLTLEIDGETIAMLEIDAARDQASAVFIETEGEGADFADLMVRRDIFYTSGPNWRVVIPAGHYFMLGDNTQNSSDSTEWQLARYRVPETNGDDTGLGIEMAGERPARIVRGSLNGDDNPRLIGIGDRDGAKLFFVDEFGEKRWFRADEAEKLSPEGAPFVPRSMIQGKALAVFWPIKPWQEIYRLKWVL